MKGGPKWRFGWVLLNLNELFRVNKFEINNSVPLILQFLHNLHTKFHEFG